jgi:hypothetical protein
MTYAEWVKANPPPNLGACQCGGYDLITPAAWAHYDQASVHEPGKPLRAHRVEEPFDDPTIGDEQLAELSTTTQDRSKQTTNNGVKVLGIDPGGSRIKDICSFQMWIFMAFGI